MSETSKSEISKVWYEEGRYRLRILSAALGESQPKDDGSITPQVELAIAVLGHYAEGGQLHAVPGGPPRTVFLSLSDACLGTPHQPGWVAQTLADLGFVGPTFADLAPLTGQERDGSCRHDTFSGEPREKWGIFRQGRTPLRPAGEKVVRGLNARHKDLLKTFALGRPAVAPLPRPAAAPARPAPVPMTAAPEPHWPEHADAQTGEEIPF